MSIALGAKFALAAVQMIRVYSDYAIRASAGKMTAEELVEGWNALHSKKKRVQSRLRERIGQKRVDRNAQT